jgi:hypothetical protein
MVKEPVQERESAVKKRRKGGSSSTSTSPAKVPERDIYKVCWSREEREAVMRFTESVQKLITQLVLKGSDDGV